jgi:phosphohistidine phosphatase
VAAGAWIVHHGLVPDTVLCSPARRTRETWHGVALALSAAPEVRYDELIYAASRSDLLDIVRSLPPTVTTALLIGHNPAVSQLSLVLDPELADRDGLRTAAAAVHAWAGDWADCGPDVAQLTASHTARAEV